MSEDTATITKLDIDYHANLDAIELIDKDKRLVTNIGSCTKSLQKFEVYMVIPTTDEEAQARYNCSLSDLVKSGVQQMSTRPNFRECFDFKQIPVETADPSNADKPYIDYPLKDGGHTALQTKADDYKVGAKRAATGAVKAKAKEWDEVSSMFTALGITDEERATCKGDQLALATLVASKTKALAKKAR